jgi:uncharacterized protein (TIGR04551 family)
MLRRRRIQWTAALAMTAPFAASIAFPHLAHAQEPPAPAASSAPASSAPTPGTAPPPGVPPVPASSGAGERPRLTVAGPLQPTATSPAAINPMRDQQALATQGAQRPPDNGEIAASPQDVFTDDWWGRVRPVVELHGYYRVRGEIYQNLDLGRHSSSLQGNDPQFLAPIPLDQSYLGPKGQPFPVQLCGSNGAQVCHDETESGANMRLRLDPEIHISDNLRIVAEIFALDNVLLGSTPNSYAMQPATSTTASTGNSSSYVAAGQNPYAPVSFFSTTQGPPTAGVNALQNSINVQRVWGEYTTPVGQLRFGRMPGQWGLGMVENAGDGIDSDYQTTLDRIMFITGIKSMDLYFGGAWDFVASGPSTATAYSVYGGEPYNDCNLCNVNEWAAFVAHRTNPELQRLQLAHGDVVVNGGLYAKFRSQTLDVESSPTFYTPLTIDTAASPPNLEDRQAWSFTPDLWLQTLWGKFRFEAEAAYIWGEIGNLPPTQVQSVTNPTNLDVRQFGLATQTEFKAFEDRLKLQFGFGWATGDPWAYNTSGGPNPTQSALNPAPSSPHEYQGAPYMSTFEFHPDYRVDLVFFRNILSRVEGAYYFRPSVDYDVIHRANGEKFGGGLAFLWDRASEFVQTPGHHRDLGVEVDAQIYYQSKDGSLNDDPNKVGGFYSALQYGVFFPLAGLDYLPGQTTLPNSNLTLAESLRLILGIVF